MPILLFRWLLKKDYPSWGWWINNGATALIEDWDYQRAGEFSDNHMMFGEIGAWFYKALGGIKPDSEHPGFRHILLATPFRKKAKLRQHQLSIAKWSDCFQLET